MSQLYNTSHSHLRKGFPISLHSHRHVLVYTHTRTHAHTHLRTHTRTSRHVLLIKFQDDSFKACDLKHVIVNLLLDDKFEYLRLESEYYVQAIRNATFDLAISTGASAFFIFAFSCSLNACSDGYSNNQTLVASRCLHA